MDLGNSSDQEKIDAGAIVIESSEAQLQEKLSAISVQPTFIIGYVSPYLDIDLIGTTLSSRFPDVPMSICSTAGELHAQEGQLYYETGHFWDRVILHIFDASIVKQAEVVSLPLDCEDLRQGKLDCSLEDRIRRLTSRIQDLPVEMDIDHRDTLAYTVFDGLCKSESFFLEALYDTGRFPCLFIGGSAGGKPDFRNTWLHDGKNTLENHVLISFLKMAPSIRFGIMKSQNFTPEDISFSILSASVEHRYVRQVIDSTGQMVRFIDALCSTFQCQPAELETKMTDYSFAIRVGEELFVRSIAKIDTEMDQVHFYCDLAPGEELLLVKRDNLPRNTLLDYQQFLEGKPGKPVAGILNDCVLRRQLNKQHHSDMNGIFEGPGIAGLSTFGETLGLYLNQTLTGIFFFKVPDGVKFEDEYVDNFAVLYGEFKAFFLKRKIAKLQGLSKIVVNQIEDFKKSRYEKHINSTGMDSTMMSVVEGLNDLGQILSEAEVQRTMKTSQIDKTLRESEKHFRLLSDSSVTGVYLVQNNMFSYVNLAFARMFGYEVDEIVNSLPPLDLVAPEDKKLVAENLRRRVAGEELSIRYTFRGLRKNGSTFHLEVHGRRIIHDGEVGVIGTFIDITEQKKAEAALLASEANYRVLYNETPSMFFTVNNNGIITAANDFAATKLGYKYDELVGCPFFSLFHEDDRKNARNDISTCYQNSGSVLSWQYRKKCKNGKLMWCEEYARSIIDPKGNRNTLIVSQDITQRKKVEESLKVSQFIFDQASIGILLISDDHRIIDVNEHGCHSLGYTKEELCNLSVMDVEPSFGKDLRNILVDQFNSKSSSTIKTTHQRKNGETIPVQVFISSLPHKESSLRVVFVQDISDMEKVRLEQENLKTQLLQVQKLESIGRLAGGIAHDLNNLLTPVLGYTGLLANDESLSEKAGMRLEHISKAALGARDLIQQLLAFSRKQVLEYNSLDLNMLIDDFSTLLRRTVRENIDLAITLCPEAAPILADQGQIEQIVMNLVVNAADAMPNGGKISIQTKLYEIDQGYLDLHPGTITGEHVILSISDTGEGMDEETLGQIFEPFFSTKGELGTGLGLATAYGIVKQHKGSIYVYSEPGLGTTFKIYLPVNDKSRKSVSSDKVRQVAPQGTETILLVEDNESVRITVSDILCQNGYKVLENADGRSALETAAEGNAFDILLTDVIMPEMNGKELFDQLSIPCPSLKVLYMSGYMDDLIAHHGILNEGVQFIQKPFSPQEILMKIRTILDS